MSEGMRKYLLKKGIKRIYSSYGASDLELNISSENPFTISLRGLINENQKQKISSLNFLAHSDDFSIQPKWFFNRK